MTTTAERAYAGSQAARRAMIDSQLRPSGVNQPFVLAAMMRTPREDFVPEALRDAAYMDRAIPLGEGRFLAAPEAHGRMLAEAAPTPDDVALLVGDGAGYLAALLRPLVGALTALEPAAFAPGGGGGAEGGARFSLVVVDGAVGQVPAGVEQALAGPGRLVTGIVERGVTRLAVGRKVGDRLVLLPLAEVGIPVLAELAAPRRWSF